MILEFLAWVLLLLLTSVGTVIHVAALTVRDLQPTLMSARATRLHRYRLAGAALEFLALGASVIFSVLVIFGATGNILLTALGAGALTLVVLLVGGIARSIARKNMDRLARPFLGDAAVLLPLIEPYPEAGQPEEGREEALEQMVEAGEKVGLLESDEHEMIRGVIRLERMAAREVMVPRIDVVAVPVDIPLRAALDVIVDGSHSRVPVYEESIDHVVGVLYAKDLLRTLRDGKADIPLHSVLRPAHFVPETKPLDELLQELQEFKVHIAIVVDEYGGTAGIITIEDVLEQIVGEIQDEYDVSEEPLIERIGDNEGVFNARVTIDDVNDALAVNLPGESDTLGGLVYQRLQKMPKVGDQVLVDGVTISVLSVVGRRIKKVRVAKTGEPAPSNSTSPANAETGQA